MSSEKYMKSCETGRVACSKLGSSEKGYKPATYSFDMTLKHDVGLHIAKKYYRLIDNAQYLEMQSNFYYSFQT